MASMVRVRPERRTNLFPLKEILMKRLIVVMMLVMFSMGLAACNTIAGAGKDVQKAGEKIEDKAEKCQDGNC